MARTVLPMAVSNVAALIDRTYRESHPYQWVREAWINSKEADATRVHFAVEWQGVENLSVYRRLILDNGTGIPADKMPLFLNTYGGSGKPIGGEHENFGHGFKTSTLPWNRNGIVVVSKSIEDGGLAMVRLEFDAKQGEYGARYEDVDGVREAVYAPYDATETDGVDYTRLVPEDWESGTAILLLGSPQQPDSILGAYDRDESDLNGIARYLNTRMWDVGDVTVTVDYFNTQNRSMWPKNFNDKSQANTSTTKWQARNARGAKYHIEFEQKSGREITGRVEASGTVPVANGLANVHWFMRSGVPTQSTSVANYRGYIGHLYKNEVYTLLNHPSTFRTFGIPGWLKENIFLIVEPKEFDGEAGAYPNDARTQLLLGGKEAGRALPIVEWANDFATNQPPEIKKVISEHFSSGGSIKDERWKHRLEERFGFLWRIIKPVVHATGKIKIQPVQPAHKKRAPNQPNSDPNQPTSEPKPRTPSNHERAKTLRTGLEDPNGETLANERSVKGGLPNYDPVGKEEMDEPWMLASWEAPNPGNNNTGRVLINRDHPVLKRHIAETQRAFVGDEDEIANEVIAVYGELAVAHIAHSERMKGVLMSERDVEDKLRSQDALTMALLGIWQIDSILLPRLSGKLTKRKIA